MLFQCYTDAFQAPCELNPDSLLSSSNSNNNDNDDNGNVNNELAAPSDEEMKEEKKDFGRFKQNITFSLFLYFVQQSLTLPDLLGL